ncbi:hypothetical protein SETIT_2G301500v2 [Setaria italica]|uniref:Ubiquitin-like protease family profile domain-containing protein n=1 Tax=Setaria italica TaxID=4555 RepID=A0A368Q4A1_SETIT|nr:hypothetical protein SETIT_2G301500v2 [Setaria italica]
MARKRCRDIDHLSYSDSDEDFNSHNYKKNFSEVEDIEISSGDDSADEANHSDCKKFKMLKNKIKSILTNQLNMQKFVKKLKYVITRFCVTDFAKVIKKLTPNQRQVIEKYGFGSLLHFDKSRLVDHKSSDIVIDGRIISLTKESVHNILGIPLSWRPFPTDISHGKSVILKNFKKQSMPKKVLSDEDTFIRFILIALNSFLCSNASNASVTPSQKHLGMFDDITNCKVFDWSGYVLSWLLRHIKTFKKGKTKAGVYGFRPILDFVDTYYAKRPHLLNSTSSLSDDSEFMEMIDLHGPRRVIKPYALFHSNFKTAKAKISVSNSELKNYKALFSLASSQYNNEDVVHLEKVRSTFYLYMKPTSNPDISKSHFFFCKYWSLFSDTLSQPLVRVFVNIKDCNFVFLDPLHHEDYDFLEIVRSRMFASFVQYWDRYVKVNMNFDEYDIVFPDVPDQPLDNTHDFFYHV